MAGENYRNSSDENLLSKYSYLVFLFIALAGSSLGLYFFLSPGDGAAYIAYLSGAPAEQILTPDNLHEHIFLFSVKFSGSILFALSILTGGIAMNAYRSGRRWAWYSMCIWPILLLVQYVIYSKSNSIGEFQFIGVAFAVLALGFKYPTTFKKRKRKKKAPAIVT